MTKKQGQKTEPDFIYTHAVNDTLKPLSQLYFRSESTNSTGAPSGKLTDICLLAKQNKICYWCKQWTEGGAKKKLNKQREKDYCTRESNIIYTVNSNKDGLHSKEGRGTYILQS